MSKSSLLGILYSKLLSPPFPLRTTLSSMYSWSHLCIWALFSIRRNMTTDDFRMYAGPLEVLIHANAASSCGAASALGASFCSTGSDGDSSSESGCRQLLNGLSINMLPYDMTTQHGPSLSETADCSRSTSTFVIGTNSEYSQLSSRWVVTISMSPYVSMTYFR